ncbi:MAG: hypothetical protein RI883_2455 [Bacteroidota bacterium]|jgi:hypothetical protein
MKEFLLFCLLFIHVHLVGQEKKSIQFIPFFNNLPLELGKKNVLNDSTWFEFSTCRFYVSNLSLLNEGKLKEKVNEFYLIDIEEPTSFFIEIKNGDYDEMSFSIGIDSTTNVAGILDGALDPINGMYWAWNSGYINFKLEGTSSESTEKNKSFEFHLGGYLAPYQTIQTVNLPIENNAKDILIGFDILVFMKEIDFNKTSNVMIPGSNAVQLSSILPSIFTVLPNEK